MLPSVSKKSLFTFALFGLILPATHAEAQEMWDSNVVSVKGRIDQQYERLGIRMPGQFLFYPGIQLEETYDDNIYRTNSDEESDFITSVQPSMRVRSDWKVHALEFLARGDLGYYNDNGAEDYEDYTVRTYGRLDVRYNTFIEGWLQQLHTHEDRSSPDDVNSDEPTELDITVGHVGFTRALGRLKLSTFAEHQELTFDNSIKGGTVINNDERNRYHQRYQLRLAYEYIPNYDIFTRYIYNIRRYDATGMADRDSDGHEIAVGTAVDISGKMRGELYAGYLAQEYDRGFDDVTEMNYGGQLLWNITGITSLTGGIDREVNETSFANASAYVRTRYRIGLEHALQQNIVADAGLHYGEDDFVSINGGSAGRQDESYGGGMGMEYYPAAGVKTRLGYQYFKRDSSIAAETYVNNLVKASFGFTY